MSESRGFDFVRVNDTSILIQAVLFDTNSARITTGSATYRLYHVVPTTGALESFDFGSGTFKTSGAGTYTSALTHRTGLTDVGGSYDTGIWNARFTVLAQLVTEDKYIIEVAHASLARQVLYTFAYGGAEGNTLQPATANATIDTTAVTTAATQATTAATQATTAATQATTAATQATAAASSASTAATQATAANVAALAAQKLGEADSVLNADPAGFTLLTRERGTDTDLIPAKRLLDVNDSPITSADTPVGSQKQ